MIKLDISDLPIAQHQYKTAGVVGVSLGALFFLMAIIFLVIVQNIRSAVNDPIKMSSDECVKNLGSLGFKAVVQDKRILIADSDISQTVSVLARSSQALSLCPNWVLEKYCLGSGCKPPGLMMSLQYHDDRPAP